MTIKFSSLSKLLTLGFCAVGVLLSSQALAATDLDKEQKEVETRILKTLNKYPTFVNTAQHWISMLKQTYGGQKIQAKWLIEYASYYFLVINKDYKITYGKKYNEYSAPSIDAFEQLVLDCTYYTGNDQDYRQSTNYHTVTKSCLAIRSVAAAAAFNGNAMQTMAMNALRDDLEEETVKSAKDLKELQALNNLDTLQISFQLRYLSLQDYKIHDLDKYFEQLYQITFSK